MFVFQPVLTLCQHRPKCKFRVDTDLFGDDPCPGTKKYLDVTYKCIPSKYTLPSFVLVVPNNWNVLVLDDNETLYSIISIYDYRLITVYLLLRVNCDTMMHGCWDFDASSAWTRRVSALDKHQNWSASALFCHNSCAQSKYSMQLLI